MTFSVLVRLHLEYFSPQHKKDINQQDRVQQRATKMTGKQGAVGTELVQLGKE